MQEKKLRKRPWIEEEDKRLETYVKLLGERKWDSIAQASGLKRSGKSCRMRWLNYLRPSIKRGHISSEEEQIIIQLQKQLGNRWSKIAHKLPGRTDNEIKNYWRTYLRKKVEANEQGDFQWSAENATQDSAHQKHTNGKQECDIAEHKPVEDSKGSPEEGSMKLYEVSNLVFPSSPFETRLFDWMSELSGDAHKIIEGGGCNVGSCLCFLAIKNEDSGNSILNSLDSLWE